MNHFVFIKVRSKKNLRKYISDNYFFAQKALLEQIYPLDFEEYFFDGEDDEGFYATMFIGLYFDNDVSIIEKVSKALCKFFRRAFDADQCFRKIFSTNDINEAMSLRNKYENYTDDLLDSVSLN